MAVSAVSLGQKWRWELGGVLPPPSRGLNHGPSSVVASLETSISDESVVSRGKRADTGVGQVGEMFHSIFRAVHKSPSQEVMLLILPVEGVV